MGKRKNQKKNQIIAHNCPILLSLIIIPLGFLYNTCMIFFES